MRFLILIVFLLHLISCSGKDKLQSGFTQPGASGIGDVLVSLPIALNTTTTIQQGQTVTWQNRDSMAHTSTSQGGEWDSGSLVSNGNFSHTFTVAGIFPYFCQLHSNETGTVQVQAPSPSPAASPFPLPSP